MKNLKSSDNIHNDPKDPIVSYNQYLKENFRQTRAMAQQNKLKWLGSGDPILQRTDIYKQKAKAPQPCKDSYFQRMKQKENELKANKKIFNTLNYETFNKPEPVHRKKQYEDNQCFRVNNQQEDKMKIKVFPEQYKNCKMGYLLTDHTETDTTIRTKLSNMNRSINSNNSIKNINNDNEKNKGRPNNKTELPPKMYTEKLFNSKKKNYITPSEEYIKFNNKKKLLPSCNRETPNYIGRHRLYKDTFDLTKNRVFNSGLGPGLKHSETNPKIRLVHKIEIKDKTDHVNGLLNYEFGPKFREIRYTENPNKNNFGETVKNTVKYLNENFITEAY